MGRRKKSTINKCPYCKTKLDDMFYVIATQQYHCDCGVRVLGNKIIQSAYAVTGDYPHYWSDKAKEACK